MSHISKIIKNKLSVCLQYLIIIFLIIVIYNNHFNINTFYHSFKKKSSIELNSSKEILDALNIIKSSKIEDFQFSEINQNLLNYSKFPSKNIKVISKFSIWDIQKIIVNSYPILNSKKSQNILKFKNEKQDLKCNLLISSNFFYIEKC